MALTPGPVERVLSAGRERPVEEPQPPAVELNPRLYKAWYYLGLSHWATGDRNSRGTTLDDVLRMLPEAWQPVDEKLAPGVLAELPAVR